MKSGVLECGAVIPLIILIIAMLAPAAAVDLPARDSVVMGMSTALTGPAADLGLHMKEGVEVAFFEANQAGGVHGRSVNLLTLDDGYEPARTAPNMRELIEQQNVLAVIGNVGTPTAIAAVPIANATRTPFIGAYTGAGVLRRTPPDRYVINYRASYAQETAAMVNALIEHAGLLPEEVAFFTQRDGYGDAGFIGGIEALKAHGLQDEHQVAHGRYERNTASVEIGLAEILLHKVEAKAIIMVGAYTPCSRFIRLARSLDYEGLFLNVSFVGSRSLANALEDDGDGVIITQVVPHPASHVSIAQQYRTALRQAIPEAVPTFGSFEGYIAARILLQALGAGDGIPSREGVVDALESLGEFNPGFEQPLTLSSSNHQASRAVWPTVIRDQQIVPFDWSSLATDSGGQ